jgi:isopentenyl phosphate kinase
MAKKNILKRIENKIDNNRVTKMIVKKMGAINHFMVKTFDSKEKMNVNMKEWSVKKRWSPMERELLDVTG